MQVTAQQAYSEIVAHIKKQGGAYSDWYCGITESIPDRLYRFHKVPEKNHWQVYNQCFTNTDARNVEASLLKLGCIGSTGGGDDDAVFVYAYLITSITNQ